MLAYFEVLLTIILCFVAVAPTLSPRGSLVITCFLSSTAWTNQSGCERIVSMSSSCDAIGNEILFRASRKLISIVLNDFLEVRIDCFWVFDKRAESLAELSNAVVDRASVATRSRMRCSAFIVECVGLIVACVDSEKSKDYNKKSTGNQSTTE